MELIDQFLGSNLHKVTYNCSFLIFMDSNLWLVPAVVSARIAMLEHKGAAWFLILLLNIECNSKSVGGWVSKQLSDDNVLIVILDGHVYRSKFVVGHLVLVKIETYRRLSDVIRIDFWHFLFIFVGLMIFCNIWFSHCNFFVKLLLASMMLVDKTLAGTDMGLSDLRFWLCCSLWHLNFPLRVDLNDNMNNLILSLEMMELVRKIREVCSFGSNNARPVLPNLKYLLECTGFFCL